MSFKETELGKIPTEWKVIKVSEYTHTVTDYVANGSFASLKNNVQYYEEPNYAVLLRLTDYNNNYNGNFIFIDKKAYEFLNKTKLYGGEIIISNVGANVGTVFKVPILEYKMNLAPNSIMVKTKGEDDFYYYWFKSRNGQQSIKSILSGSAQPKFNKTSFKNLYLPVPPLEEQKAIAKILSDLDEKIEVNNKINKNLEEMAQAIFKQWFVDFEFPNEEGKPYKSSGGEMVESELGMIPKGWKIFKLGDFIKFIKGKKPKKIEEKFFDGCELYLTIDVLNRNSEIFANKDKIIEVNDDDILMVMDGASSGSLYYGLNGILGSTLAKISVLNTIDKSFLYYYLKLNESSIKSHLTGSAIPHTDKEFINKLCLAIPNDEMILKKADTILNNIRNHTINLNTECSKIKKVRDTLLPKLMSGEIRVPLENSEN
ncbi:restriction endonuclease subunit S [Clostridium perfringens]|uniref:restriction endonuclease subunit S n=1 Tax=Clostridium perfringens TaxID=1502 RepID=UPI002A171B0A|nr:restriction endonuclease subunit S [Clostridium perfringens]MDK0749092.1 restriction endonuclease subunit S [Clostridium perfringens]MDM0886581.1 restriction endonuclease subunit S [Clostridium perfringens]MDM0898385.1 restriction endonuclease subunit S [Clostridium perfringens]MDM0904218.1 restriction endonuclease subunit S [Clostridium perfringens]MDM0907526.1 restriction endonuclease subunit S [Clostridium perfringens]